MIVESSVTAPIAYSIRDVRRRHPRRPSVAAAGAVRCSRSRSSASPTWASQSASRRSHQQCQSHRQWSITEGSRASPSACWRWRRRRNLVGRAFLGKLGRRRDARQSRRHHRRGCSQRSRPASAGSSPPGAARQRCRPASRACRRSVADRGNGFARYLRRSVLRQIDARRAFERSGQQQQQQRSGTAVLPGGVHRHADRPQQ